MKPDKLFILLLIAVGAGLIWLQIKRPSRKRLVWRILASVVAPLSLYFLWHPPILFRAVPASQAILLTDGYHPDTLQHLLQTIKPTPKIWRYKVRSAKGEVIRNLSELRQKQPAISTVHLLGYGLDSTELAGLQNMRIRPHLSVAPGITFADWGRKIPLGQPLTISGQYRAINEKQIWIQLLVAGQAQDSVKLSGSGLKSFRVEYTPKVAGRFVYQLQVKKSAAVVTMEPIPVIVTQPRPLTILLLAGSPGFEFKFLKNLLAAQRHQVVFRTSISRNKYQTEFLNTSPVNVTKLTSPLLRRFDAVLTDAAALAALSGGERQAVRQAVGTNGTGLLVLANDIPLPAGLSLLQPFKLRRVSHSGNRTSSISWPGGDGRTPIPLLPFTITSNTNLTRWAQDTNRETVLAAYPYHRGQVALSMVPATYPWQLNGQGKTHRAFWSDLLSFITRKNMPEERWQLALKPFPLTNQKLTLFLSDFKRLPQANIPQGLLTSPDSNQTELYLKQEPLLSYQFSGNYWPREPGWHTVQTTGGLPWTFYIFPAKAWQTHQRNQLRSQTVAFLQQSSEKMRTADKHYSAKPLPAIYFFILFVLTVGFYWLEEKL